MTGEWGEKSEESRERGVAIWERGVGRGGDIIHNFICWE